MSRAQQSTTPGSHRPSRDGARNARALVLRLLRWFARQPRDLPWRRTLDPYAIWISEIMLQQTQVKTVVPYWERWMRALPDVRALAAASKERVLKLWEGLGYYTRARNLQKAAVAVVTRHGGVFPQDFGDVIALPGVGRYTAGALCSIAFNQPTPIVDGNVIRVLTRLFGIRTNARAQRTSRRLWGLATTLVQAAAACPAPDVRRPLKLSGSCSALNQALMEFGALICTPRQPRCSECPLASHCLGRQRGIAERLPNLGERTRSTIRHHVAIVVERRGRYLVRQRPCGAVNAGLWEFPTQELASGDDPLATAVRSLGLKPDSVKPLCVVNHSITRYRIALRAMLVSGAGRSLPKAPGQRWLSLDEVQSLAFTGAHRRILRALEALQPQGRA